MNPRTLLAAVSFFIVHAAFAFEGRITAAFNRGGQAQTVHYTISPGRLRIELGETDRPHAKNIVDLGSGAVTLLFPHNRTFVRLKDTPPAAPTGMPPGVGARGFGPQAITPPATPALGPTNLPNGSALPQMPAIPQVPPGLGPQSGLGPPGMPAMPMMMEQPELKATDHTTNLLGYACTRYELKQRGEVMEIWATDKLLPFRAWQPNQPPRFGPRMIEEQWGELLRAKKLFPLLAIVRFENGPERLRFEVTSIKPEKIEDKDGSLFQSPQDYREIEPLPF
jgi:hypothetical protein